MEKTKKKQIDEMAKAIIKLDYCEGYKDDRGCMYAPSCSVCKFGRENKAKQISELFAKQGYRKATEVAEEIFAEIENLILDGAIGGKYPVKVINPVKYAELKKKFTEDGE